MGQLLRNFVLCFFCVPKTNKKSELLVIEEGMPTSTLAHAYQTFNELFKWFESIVLTCDPERLLWIPVISTDVDASYIIWFDLIIRYWSTTEILNLIFYFSKYFFFSNSEENWGHLEKVASRHSTLLRILFKIKNGFWVDGEFNRFGLGRSISPIVEICL